MTNPAADTRSPQRKTLDELIASEPPLPIPDLPVGTATVSVEAHLGPRWQPVAVAGVVENGVVRPVDPSVRLPERARVIIVASGRG